MTDDLGARLDALSDEQVARRAARHTQCLRGIRGVPASEVARMAAAVYTESPPRLPDDLAALDRMFGSAFEDGLIAIALLATCVADAPEAALELALDWAERTDDVTTADALGWLVLAPAALMTSKERHVVGRLGSHPRPETRRAVLAMALGFTPAPVEGPAAAALRAKLGERHVRLVAAALSDRIGPIADRFVRDANPQIQKALRRLLRSWSDADPEAVLRWAAEVRGGLPRLLGDEVARTRRAVARGAP